MKYPPGSGGHDERVPKILSFDMDRCEGGTSFRLDGVVQNMKCPFLLVHGIDDQQIPEKGRARPFSGRRVQGQNLQGIQGHRRRRAALPNRLHLARRSFHGGLAQGKAQSLSGPRAKRFVFIHPRPFEWKYALRGMQNCSKSRLMRGKKNTPPQKSCRGQQRSD